MRASVDVVVDVEGMQRRHSRTLLGDLLWDRAGGVERLRHVLNPVYADRLDALGVSSCRPMMHAMLQHGDHELLYATLCLCLSQFTDMRKWFCDAAQVRGFHIPRENASRFFTSLNAATQGLLLSRDVPWYVRHVAAALEFNFEWRTLADVSAPVVPRPWPPPEEPSDCPQ